MRRKIHGWMLALWVLGAGCLGIAARAATEPRTSTDKRDAQSADEPALAPPNVPPNPSLDPDSGSTAQTTGAKPSKVPHLTPPSHAGATQPEPTDRSRVRLSRPQTVSKTGTAWRGTSNQPERLPINLAGYAPLDQGTNAGNGSAQDAGARRPVAQFARQAPGGVPAQPVRRETQQPGQPPETAQIPSFVGQVDVQGLDQLGVIILRGNPQDVENMKKIIEEIQRISEAVEPFIRVFQLQRAAATQVRDTILEIYSGSTGTTTSAPRTTTTQQPAGAQPAGAAQATAVLQAPVLKRFQIAADERSNTLVVSASPQMMEELSRLIERLDIDGAPIVNEVRVFQLKNAEATEVTNILLQAISGQAAAPGGETIAGAAATVAGGAEARLANRSAVLRFVPLDGESRAIDSGILDEIRVTAQIRTNSVIVSAPASSMPLLAAVVYELDRPPSLVADMKVFTLQNSDATNMRQTLAELFDIEVALTGTGVGGFAGQTTQAQFQRPIAVAEGNTPPVSIRVAIDARTNSLIVSGAPNAIEAVEAVIRKIDSNDLLSRQNAVIRLRNAAAANVAVAVTNFFNQKRQVETQIRATQQQQDLIGAYQRLEQEVIVVAEQVTNSILLSSSPRFFDSVMKMIDELDRLQQQVMIQVMIARLDLRDDFEFGLEWGLQDSLLFDRGATGLPGTGRAPGTPGFNFNTSPLPGLGNSQVFQSSRVAGQSVSNFSLGRVSAVQGLEGVSGLVLAASSESVSALLRALESKNYVEIITRPQVMTLDGRAARIQVGQKVPYSASPAQPTTGQQTTAGETTFLDVGIILDVTPTISPDGRVVLQIVPEVSEVTDFIEIATILSGTTTIPIRAPLVSITLADTVVSVKDGQTIVLGGMIQPREVELEHKIPWLGDLPYIGSLFRYSRTQNTKTELLIVLTPHIMKGDEDVQRIKDTEVERVNWILCNGPSIHGDLGLTPKIEPIIGPPLPVDEGLMLESTEQLEVLPMNHATAAGAETPVATQPAILEMNRIEAVEPMTAPSDWAVSQPAVNPTEPAAPIAPDAVAKPRRETLGEKWRRWRSGSK